MSAPNLKTWRLDKGVYVSPRFTDVASFNRCKTFFIRAGVFADCDEGNRMIKIPVANHAMAKKNLENLTRLNLLT